MRKALLLIAIIAATRSMHAEVPADLRQLASQIEKFPLTKGEESESKRLAKFFDIYWAASMRDAPDYATYIGYPGLGDRLPNFSEESIEFSRRLVHIELAALSSIDESRLTPAEQLNYELARRQFQLGIESERFRGAGTLVSHMNNSITQGLVLLSYMPAVTVADYDDMLARLRGFPRMVDQGIARLELGLKLGVTPPRVTLGHAAQDVLGFTSDDPLKSEVLQPFTKIPETIPAPERERLQRTAVEIYRTQDVPALHKLHDYLAATYVPHTRESIAVGALPDGKARYAFLLRIFTTTDLTPEQIHELGLAEVKRIRAEMDQVMKSTGFTGTFDEFSTFLRTDPRFFYDKPEDLVAGYRDIAKRIDPELAKLFGHLPRLPYGVKPMTQGTATAPSAMYSNGTAAANRPGRMLVNTFDLKARPKWAMESLTAHESVPGHHLQYSIAEEIHDLPEWRRWDVYPVFSEGWGLYAETIGDELGLYKDPYSKYGQLTNEIWRAIRLVVDTGLHAMGWTREETIRYCRANSAKTDREIENEVDRYITSPGGVTAYKIGELKIRVLRSYAEKELGEKFDIRAFHDEVLGGGQLPLDLLEKRIRAWVEKEKHIGSTRGVVP
jgi:uncharacterized protein (DUF885 family)